MMVWSDGADGGLYFATAVDVIATTLIAIATVGLGLCHIIGDGYHVN